MVKNYKTLEKKVYVETPTMAFAEEALASVVGLAYYLRFAALLFLPPERSGSRPPRARAPGAVGRHLGTRWAVGLTLAVSVVLSVAPALVVGLLAP